MNHKRKRIELSQGSNDKNTMSEAIANEDRMSLYVHKSTLSCALEKNCIPCIYKLFPHGIQGLPSNIRPELCPRYNNKSLNVYPSLVNQNQQILTIGDGDFSFSLSLIKISNARNQNNKFVGTSYESRETILKIYSNSDNILNNLEKEGAIVFHNIDAKNLQSQLQLKPFKRSFHIIIWNFPCVASPNGKDGQVQEINDNVELLTSFFSSCKKLLIKSKEKGEYGEVRITHKTIEPFCWWNILQIAENCGWYHIGSVVFDKCLYKGYNNRKALDKKSFPCNDALTYVFTPFKAARHLNLSDRINDLEFFDYEKLQNILTDKFSTSSN